MTTKSKGGGGSTRGGGIGRVTHPADPTLRDIARAQRKVYKKAQQDVEVTLWEYIFLGKRPDIRRFNGGQTVGGGTGRLRVNRTKKRIDPEKLLRGLAWASVSAYVAYILYLANRESVNITNDKAAEVMADGATATAYTFREEYDALPYTEQVVEAIARDNLLTLPCRTVDKRKDMDWTQRMLQSIVHRYSLDDIDPEKLPHMIARTLVQRCQRSMDTSTQAMIYGAFDAGMYQAGLDAVKAGVDVEKTWLSIMDEHIRDSHHHLHKTTLPMRRLFHGLYGNLRFPHDPNAPAAEIMRCRCRMAIHLKGKAPTAPDKLTRSEVASYRRWRDKVIDDLGGELALEAAHRRRLHGR